MKGFNPRVRGIAGCSDTQQIFRRLATQIDMDPPLSDYRDVRVRTAVWLQVCVYVCLHALVCYGSDLNTEEQDTRPLIWCNSLHKDTGIYWYDSGQSQRLHQGSHPLGWLVFNPEGYEGINPLAFTAALWKVPELIKYRKRTSIFQSTVYLHLSGLLSKASLRRELLTKTNYLRWEIICIIRLQLNYYHNRYYVTEASCR